MLIRLIPLLPSIASAGLVEAQVQTYRSKRGVTDEYAEITKKLASVAEAQIQKHRSGQCVTPEATLTAKTFVVVIDRGMLLC